MPADSLEPVTRDHVLRDFAFRSGRRLRELRIRCTTLGNPSGLPVLVLHGTAGRGSDMLAPGFAGALFGPGQPLDARRHWLILPDALGTGGSSKPSDGMRADFPAYGYDDMVAAQHRLVTEALGLARLRLVIGYSMGGMHTWLWGTRHPGVADTLVPMAALPAPLSGRNWMMRRMIIDAIRTDPAWDRGNYLTQPAGLRLASAWFAIATSGGSHGHHARCPTSVEADAWIDERLAAGEVGDANDVLYQFEAARGFDPTRELCRIEVPVLAINSRDDERNPPELGLLEAAIERLPRGEMHMVAGGPDTLGHATVLHQAARYADVLARFLARVPS